MSRHHEALECYQLAILVDNNNSITWTQKAISLEKIGLYEDSLNACSKALEIDAKNFYALAQKGRVLFKMNRYQESLNTYKIAFSLNPDDSKIVFDYSFVTSYIGEIEEAKRLASISAENISEEYLKSNKLRTFFHALGQSKKLFERAKDLIEIKEGDSEFWIYYASLFEDIGDWNNALIAYQSASKIDHENYWIKYKIGFALEKLGSFRDALASYKAALQINPHYRIAKYRCKKLYKHHYTD